MDIQLFFIMRIDKTQIEQNFIRAQQKALKFNIMDTLSDCEQEFIEKYEKYGNSFYFYTAQSMSDQIISKLMRIDNVLKTSINKVQESVEETIKASINYLQVLHAMIKENGSGSIYSFSYRKDYFDVDLQFFTQTFNENILKIVSTYKAKNEDYANAVFTYSTLSIVQISLSKLLRIKNILRNDLLTNNGFFTTKDKILDDINDTIVYLCIFLYLGK